MMFLNVLEPRSNVTSELRYILGIWFDQPSMLIESVSLSGSGSSLNARVVWSSS